MDRTPAITITELVVLEGHAVGIQYRNTAQAETWTLSYRSLGQEKPSKPVIFNHEPHPFDLLLACAKLGLKFFLPSVMVRNKLIRKRLYPYYRNI